MSWWITRAQRLYAHLPAPARTYAASAFGYYLRHWRYGRETERLVREALARDSWTHAQWSVWQAERLQVLLLRAATRVPHYRDHWARRRAAGDDASWLELNNWPILEKDALRAAPETFLADDVAPRRLIEIGTSGTTGTPIRLWRSRETDRAWYALFEARKRRWYGVDRSARWAITGGKPIVPADQRHPPYWVWNAGLNQLYLSGLHVGRDTVAAYLDALAKYRVTHLVGHPSLLYALAWMASEQGLSAPRMEVVISNAEPLLPQHRQAIGQLFQCPVRDTYGMSEIVAAANECEHGVMHWWPDVGLVEVVDDGDRPIEPGAAGEFLCTGLLNADMPLIRYRIGDRGALALDDDSSCACGRRLPVLERLEGRSTDNLVTPDGRRIFWVEAVVFDGLPTLESQVIQHSLERVEVIVVPANGFDDEAERRIVERFGRLMGEGVKVSVRRVASIPRGPNGKFRSLVSHVR